MLEDVVPNPYLAHLSGNHHHTVERKHPQLLTVGTNCHSAHMYQTLMLCISKPDSAYKPH